MSMYEVAVAKDLADLIPDFMANRQKDAEALRAALAEADVAQLRQIAHRMKGVGSSYGFHDITALGRQIGDAARMGAMPAVAQLLEAYETYLSEVTVTFV